MRTVTYGAACSLDMFIAGPDEAMDWLLWTEDVNTVMAEFWAGIDTVVVGRKTYEFGKKMGGGPAMPGISSYVCSRTLAESPDEGVTIVQDAVPFIRELKRQPGRGICLMGGGELARSLFEADLIDEVGVNIHPVLLGAGVPMFPGPVRRTDLELVNTRPLKGGCVLANYRVRHAGV